MIFSELMSIYFSRLVLKGTNLRTEPKHIVFLSKLLLLFKFCHICKADNPLVEAHRVGTEAVVKTTCSTCKKENVWHSQPTMPESSIPAGNSLLCMAILLAGGLQGPTDILPHGPGVCITQHIFQIPAGEYTYQTAVITLRYGVLT